MATTIAILAALGAACCFAAGSVVQQGVARRSGQEAMRLRLLIGLFRQRRWLGGVALNLLSFCIQGVGLAFGPLSLVQPIAATDVLFALPMIARRYRRRLSWRDASGAITVTAGVVVFLAISPPVSGMSAPGLPTWLPVFVATGALVAVAGLLGMRVGGRLRVVWLALAAGALYGLLDALTKSSVDLLTAHGAGVTGYWEPYALGATALLGALFGQSAFSAGALALSLPVIDTLEPVSAVVIGATVFGERLAASPGQLAIQLLGGATAVVGIGLLSRSAIVEVETRSPAPVADARQQSR